MQVLHVIHLVMASSSVNYIFVVCFHYNTQKTIYLFKCCYLLLKLLFFK